MMAAFLLLLAAPAFAQVAAVTDGAQTVAANAGLDTSADLATIVGRIIYGFLGLLGIIAVGLVVYAGYLWTTSAGNEEQVARAKNILKNAVIGLILIFSSWAIVAFILNTLLDDGSTIGGSNATPFTRLFNGTRGQDALGNGLIQYHYPEPNQTNVYRNTKLAITFKKPLVLSSVFQNYDDNGTYTVDDDKQCPSATPCRGDAAVKEFKDLGNEGKSAFKAALVIDPDVLRLIPVADLGTPSGSDADAQYDARQPADKSVAPMQGNFTPVSVVFNDAQLQTITLRPTSNIGSASSDVNYRVSLRGGENGIKVWTAKEDGTPLARTVFVTTYSDGAYFWNFTTGTLIDTVPPKISAIEPDVVPTTSQQKIYRNQVLQVYFDEAVDPTTASGDIGNDSGFTNVRVNAECLQGTGVDCIFNSTSTPPGANAPIAGTVSIGNRYRTMEFIASTLCESGAINSCGEKVRCLPKNVSLDMHLLAANVGADAPQASEANGVQDMAGNSFDGNRDGLAQGPVRSATFPTTTRTEEFSYNQPPSTEAEIALASDTAKIVYKVGSDVDLVPPRIVDLDPQSPAPVDTLYPGPSGIPPDLQPSVTFSKTMRTDTMISGGYKEIISAGTPTGEYTVASSTLVLRSRECAKDENSPPVCTSEMQTCPCTLLEPPSFFPNALNPFELQVDGVATRVSKVEFRHPARLFYTANDLGYTEAEIEIFPNIPIYVPIIRAKIQDTRQNCFYPSVYKTADSTVCQLSDTKKSCCDKMAVENGISGQSFLGSCAPVPPTQN